MVVWTRQQQIAVAILPKISSFCTFCGSLWMTIEIITHKGHHADVTAPANSSRARKPKLHHPYHRLLLGMSIYDMLEAVWNFQSTWPIPKENAANRIWASGTRGTCSAQGFFLQIAVGVPIYNAFLAMYYMLVIYYGFTEATLVKYVEPTMHIVAFVIAFGSALTMVIMGYMNDANLWCWIAPYPPGCLNSLQYGYPPENTKPCTRGDYAWVMRYALYFGPVWTGILIATFSTFLMYFKVKRIDQRSMKYTRPEMSNDNIQMSNLFTRSQRFSRLSSREDSSSPLTNSQASVQLFTQSQRISRFSAREDSMTNSQASAQFDENQSIGAAIAEQEEFEDNLLSGKAPGMVPDDSSLRDSNRTPTQVPLRSLTRTVSSAMINPWKQRQQMKIKAKRTNEVARQAFYYLGAFYLTHVWSTTNRIYQQLHNGKSIFPLTVIHSFFDPFQGFMNFVVYQRPRYLVVRKRYPHLGRLGAIWRILHLSCWQDTAKERKSQLERTTAINATMASASRFFSSWASETKMTNNRNVDSLKISESTNMERIHDEFVSILENNGVKKFSIIDDEDDGDVHNTDSKRVSKKMNSVRFEQYDGDKMEFTSKTNYMKVGIVTDNNFSSQEFVLEERKSHLQKQSSEDGIESSLISESVTFPMENHIETSAISATEHTDLLPERLVVTNLPTIEISHENVRTNNDLKSIAYNPSLLEVRSHSSNHSEDQMMNPTNQVDSNSCASDYIETSSDHCSLNHSLGRLEESEIIFENVTNRTKQEVNNVIDATKSDEKDSIAQNVLNGSYQSDHSSWYSI